jgi:hypothetical protein
MKEFEAGGRIHRSVSRRLERLEERAAVASKKWSHSVRILLVHPGNRLTGVLLRETGKPTQPGGPPPSARSGRTNLLRFPPKWLFCLPSERCVIALVVGRSPRRAYGQNDGTGAMPALKTCRHCGQEFALPAPPGKPFGSYIDECNRCSTSPAPVADKPRQQINRKIQGFSSGVANPKEDSQKLAAHLATSQGSLQGVREPLDF